MRTQLCLWVWDWSIMQKPYRSCLWGTLWFSDHVSMTPSLLLGTMWYSGHASITYFMDCSHFMQYWWVQITKQKSTNKLGLLLKDVLAKWHELHVPLCPTVANKVVFSVQHSGGIPHESKILTGVLFAFHSHFMQYWSVQITKQKSTNNIRTPSEGRAGKWHALHIPPCPIVASKVIFSVRRSEGIPHESKILLNWCSVRIYRPHFFIGALVRFYPGQKWDLLQLFSILGCDFHISLAPIVQPKTCNKRNK
jgi:hypothetical protein